MICALSGETPEEPVVSVRSGHVFEKRLILKYLEANNNKDPFSEGVLTLEELIPLKVNKVVKPRPTNATSIPGLLQIFQNEWDALMLETYSLKQQLESVRQELSQALYQHDAACRVIARLIKERDEARNLLSTMQTYVRSSSEDTMELEGTPESGIGEEIKARLTAKSQELSKERRKRAIPENLASSEKVKEYQVIASNNLHKTTPPGVLCLDIHPSEEMIITGGADSDAVIFNTVDSKVFGRLTGHSKAVTDVLFHPSKEIIFTTSKDKTAKLWVPSESGHTVNHTVNVHSDEVVGCTLHATGDFWVTASLDSTWAFHDIATSNTLVKVDAGSSCSCVSFHPDGLILGTGTINSIKIWDIKTQKNAATFEGHTGKISSLSFSENGYYLATAAGNTVKLWDLRKLKNITSINITDGGNINALSWDYSGTYLAVAGEDIRVLTMSGKEFSQIATFKQHSKTVTDVKWGSAAQFLASTSMDRSLKLWSSK